MNSLHYSFQPSRSGSQCAHTFSKTAMTNQEGVAPFDHGCAATKCVTIKSFINKYINKSHLK